ncbi:unnamed protein product, partial [Porites evermanni]
MPAVRSNTKAPAKRYRKTFQESYSWSYNKSNSSKQPARETDTSSFLNSYKRGNNFDRMSSCCFLCKLVNFIEIIQSWPGCDEMDASTANSCFRVPRTVKEDQSALVSVARPSGTKNKHKWMVEILREWQRTRTLKPPDLEVGNVSKITIFTTCVL